MRFHEYATKPSSLASVPHPEPLSAREFQPAICVKAKPIPSATVRKSVDLDFETSPRFIAFIDAIRVNEEATINRLLIQSVAGGVTCTQY